MDCLSDCTKQSRPTKYQISRMVLLFTLEILCLYGMNCPLQNENQKFCEQLRVNALSVSVLPPSSLSLTIPETAWLSLFPPRSFSDATLLYSQPLEDPDVTSEPPQLAPGLQAKFGSVVTDLYCMAGARAPLHKLQLLTSAFRKTMASLSALKLQSLLEEGDSLCVCVMCKLSASKNCV